MTRVQCYVMQVNDNNTYYYHHHHRLLFNYSLLTCSVKITANVLAKFYSHQSARVTRLADVFSDIFPHELLMFILCT